MNNERKNEEVIFMAALDYALSPEREAYIRKACGDDQELLNRVKALLASHEQEDGFLEVPPDNSGITLNKVIEGPGTKIGNYDLLEQIGEGGMGLVYLAEQKDPKRKVALKIVKLGMDTKQVVARFEAERQTLALLAHPNIAHVFDAGTTDTGRPYFVMEYVQGKSITKYCDEYQLSVEQRLELFQQVCEGVHHAHQKGIIHRDLKPSNILVSVHGDRAVPKIIDFGIAKAITQPLTEKTSYTEHGQLLGTPEYMSPEQAEMAYQEVDTRSDIYSLGVLLYELLTGATPFDAKGLRKGGIDYIQQVICSEEPRTPSARLTSLGDRAKAVADSRRTQIITLTRRLHRELEWIPMKAMRKERARRYRSASELSDDIQNYLTGVPLIAGPESNVYRARKFVRKHAGSVTSAALVAVVIILGLVASIVMGCRAEQAREKAVDAQEKIEQALARAVQAEKRADEHSEDYRRELYFKRIALAHMAYRNGNLSRIHALLEECPEDLRAWEWYRLKHISSNQPHKTLNGHNGAFGLAVSPDGKRIASNGDNMTIKVWDARTGEVLITLPGHDDVFNPVSFSPDGRKIASSSKDKTIKIWDAESGAELITLQGHSDIIRALAFSPDGKHIASAGHDKIVKIWNVETAAELMVLRGHTHRITDAVFSPDSTRVVSSDAGAEGTVKVWEVSTGTELMTLRGHGNGVYCLAFSPDNKKIASGSQDETVKIWDAESGVELMTFSDAGFAFAVSFSPDSRHIVSGGGLSGFRGAIKIWNTQRPNEVRVLPGHEGGVRAAVFSPDGNAIISSGRDKTIKIWDLRIDRVQKTLEPRRLKWSTVWPVSFSPDGTRLASACGPKNEMIQVWDVATGTELMTLQGHADRAGATFSPDNKRILSCSDDKSIKIWDALTGKELITLRGHANSVGAVFSPDGKKIVSGSWDKTIKVWDASTGTELLTLQGHESEVLSVAVIPDGKRIVSSSRAGLIKVWDAIAGTELMTLRGHKGVCRAAVSPNGQWIASAGNDGTVRLWDAKSGDELMTLRGYNYVRASVAFTPDSKRIISGGQSEAKVWDVATGTEVMTLHEGSFPVAVSADGKTIASSTENGIVLYESEMPAEGYEPRRIGIVARRRVSELHKKHGLYANVINKLKNDDTLEDPVRKLALQIANARLWEDAEKR